MAKLCHQLGAVELLNQFENAQLNAEELAQEVISNYNENIDLNAISYLEPDVLLGAARHADRERSAGRASTLCGLPFAIKDNINTTTYPTTAGTTALLNHQTKTSAGVVLDLEEQGAIVGAKATMHELALGITSNNTVTGAVCNPHDITKIAGGSSGGTASAVAVGIFPAGLGSDTGGSVRIPAALCGIVGFRPTTDSYAGDGIVPICHSRDTVGPMARSVEDIVLIDSVLRRKYNKPDDSFSMSDVTLGIPTNLLYDNLESEVEVAIQEQLRLLENAGAKLKEVSFEHAWEHLHDINYVIGAYEAYRDMTSYLETHAPHLSIKQLIEEIGSPDIGSIFQDHDDNNAVSDDFYRTVMNVHRPAMQARYEDVFKTNRLSAIVFPTTQVRARDIGQDDFVDINGQSVSTFSAYIRNTEPGSVLGVPGVSLPCQNVEGLPIGIELDGLARNDGALLTLASLVEQVI